MPTERTTSNGFHRSPPPSRSTDEQGRLLPISDERRRSRIEEINRTFDELATMVDATDTPERWEEILRNLGVDPATGRGLES